jgi:hypothetical protein
MIGKVILSTAILFAPFFLLCAVTILFEGSQRLGHAFDKATDKLDNKIARNLERMLR